MLGPPAGTTPPSNGNGNTSDADDDVGFAQTVNVSTGAPRAPGIASNRLLAGGRFDYALGSTGPAFLGTAGRSDLFYGVSSGPTASFRSADQDGPFLARVLRVQIDLRDIEVGQDDNGLPVLQPGLRFAGEDFVRDDATNTYQSPTTQRVIIADGDDFFIDARPLSQGAESAVFLGGNVTTGRLSAFGGASFLVPESAFGASNTVITSTLNRRLPFEFFGFFFDNSTSSGTQFYDPRNGAATFDDYANSLISFLLSDPISVNSPNFVARNPQGQFDLRFATLRAGNRVEGFQFIQASDFAATGRTSNLFIHAAGDVSDNRNGAFSIDRFALTRGLSATDLVGGQLPGLASPRAFRGFLPDSATPSGIAATAVAATPLIVINPADASGPVDIGSRLLHFDLAVSADGASTTASATLGALTYSSSALSDAEFDTFDAITGDPVTLPAANFRSLVQVSGRTIGATAAPATGSALLRSPLVATAYGGGRSWTGSVTGDRPGYAGYLVLENANQIDSGNVADTGNAATGGIINPLGVPTTGSDTQSYGVLRLASGVTTANTRPGPTLSTTLSGYVAGAVQYEASSASNIVTPYQGTIDLTLDPLNSRVEASIAYRVPGTGAAGGPPALQTLRLGEAASGPAIAGGIGTYVDPGNFAALVDTDAGAKSALVSGEAVKAGIAGATIATYAHVQWGFFFGDMLPQVTGRTYTPLSTWVAGARYTGANASIGADSAMRGSVRYGGHAIGTVVTQPSGGAADIATRTGSFTQNWNLNSRTGTMDLTFDGQQFNAIPLAVNGSTGLGYAQTASNEISVAGARRGVDVRGELVSVASPTSLPGGTLGEFKIRGVDASYQANGTFAGDRGP